MDLMTAMQERHCVRNYLDVPIPQDLRDRLLEEAAKINEESGLNIQVFFDEPECFQTGMSRYGSFSNVKNYFSIVGKKGADLDEKAGYYGMKFTLILQSLGLNSCWVALTHGKSQAVVGKGEKEDILVSFGYGVTQGRQHWNRPVNELCEVTAPVPDWFVRGMEGALLAPTARNQQKFLITYDGTSLRAKATSRMFYASIDLGIVKYCFELASGKRFDQ